MIARVSTSVIVSESARMTAALMGVFAEFERAIIQERVRAR
jgi:DNA invertase Pin-like site-specific DNA recombinase